MSESLISTPLKNSACLGLLRAKRARVAVVDSCCLYSGQHLCSIAVPCPKLAEMRPLTDDETKAVLGKVDKFIGTSVKLLVDRQDGVYCFRVQKDRVFYISERVLKVACNVPREQLLMMGVCFGKFTKTGEMRPQL